MADAPRARGKTRTAVDGLPRTQSSASSSHINMKMLNNGWHVYAGAGAVPIQVSAHLQNTGFELYASHLKTSKLIRLFHDIFFSLEEVLVYIDSVVSVEVRLRCIRVLGPLHISF